MSGNPEEFYLVSPEYDETHWDGSALGPQYDPSYLGTSASRSFNARYQELSPFKKKVLSFGSAALVLSGATWAVFKFGPPSHTCTGTQTLSVTEGETYDNFLNRADDIVTGEQAKTHGKVFSDSIITGNPSGTFVATSLNRNDFRSTKTGNLNIPIDCSN